MRQEAVVDVGVENLLLFKVLLEVCNRNVEQLKLVVLVVDGLTCPRTLILASLFIV